jgi:hypothetical protein
MSLEWTGWAVAIILGILFPLWHYGEAFFRKKYIEVYREMEKDGMTYLSQELEIIGEYKKATFNKERDMYELEFRDGTKRIKIYSPIQIDDLISHWLIKKYFIIFFLCDAYVYEQKVEPYEKKMDYSMGWKLWFVYYAMFSLTPTGFCVSAFLMGVIISAFANWSFLVFLIGALVGILMSAFNSILVSREIIKPEKKTETITTESYLVPIESKIELVEKYRVTYMQRVQVIMPDGASEMIEKIRHKLIKGYEKLQDLYLNPNILVDRQSLRIAGVEERMKTIPQMKSDRRNFLARNKYLWSMIIGKNRNMSRLQFEIKELHEQMAYIEETKDQEIKELGIKLLIERDKNRNTLKAIFQRLFTAQFIEKNWESALKDAIQEIEAENTASKLDKLDQIIELFTKLIEKLGQSKGFDVEEFRRYFKQTEKEAQEFAGGNGKKQKLLENNQTTGS